MVAIIPQLVSTIIPVFNRPQLLREAVQSVLNQTYRPIEIIIVDDESTDDTPDCIRQLTDASPDIVRSARQKNRGPGAARETGRLMTRGEYLQYLDSDDLLLPLKFERQVAALTRRPDAGAAYCWTQYRKIGELPFQDPWKGSGTTLEAMFPSFLNERWWDTPTPLYRRSVCDAAGPWIDSRLEEDWEYDCRIAALGTKLVHCKEFLVEVRDHTGERLCRGSALDKNRLKMRVRSHQLVYGHASRAGITNQQPEMQQFSRSLFLLARQCGAAGLPHESRQLFLLAQEASGSGRSNSLDFTAYRASTYVLGWSLTGWLSCALDSLRQRTRKKDDN